MAPLLFLSQRIPFPPDKGDKIRSFAMLRHLSRRWAVHLGCFVDDEADLAHVPALKEYCAEAFCLPLDRRRAALRALGALGDGGSMSAAWFRHPAMAAWVARVLQDVRPPAAYLFSSVTAQYLSGGPRPGRVAMDYGDVDSDKWRQYAKRRSWPFSSLYAAESRRLLEFERRWARAADACVFVSEAEAGLFRRLAPEAAGQTIGISNGIDHGYFSPAHAGADPFSGALPLVFTGAMDYWPNVDAACWFAGAILPRIRQALPGAGFWVVGSNPAPQVRALAGIEGVEVTGRVPDVRPYLAHAGAVVAPLRVARGIQNKVLEGMAMAKAVVTTPEGLEGIDAQPGRDLLVAANEESFARESVRALCDPEAARIGAAARARILAAYDWSDKAEAMGALLEGNQAGGG